MAGVGRHPRRTGGSMWRTKTRQGTCAADLLRPSSLAEYTSLPHSRPKITSRWQGREAPGGFQRCSLLGCCHAVSANLQKHDSHEHSAPNVPNFQSTKQSLNEPRRHVLLHTPVNTEELGLLAPGNSAPDRIHFCRCRLYACTAPATN